MKKGLTVALLSLLLTVGIASSALAMNSAGAGGGGGKPSSGGVNPGPFLKAVQVINKLWNDSITKAPRISRPGISGGNIYHQLQNAMPEHEAVCLGKYGACPK